MSDTAVEPAPEQRAVPRAINVGLGIGAVLGALCVVFAAAAMFFSLTPLIVASGSMAPALPTGSIAIGKETSATEVRPGDVVSITRTDGSRVTHRVERVATATSNTAVLILKGDANPQEDQDPYEVTSVAKVVTSVPYLGYGMAWLKTPPALLLGGALALGLVYLIVRPSTPGNPESKTGRHRAIPIALAVCVAGASMTGLGRMDTTLAALSDTATARASVTAATLARPTSFTCSSSLLTANLSWVPSNPLYGHRLTYRSAGGQVVVDNFPAGTTTATPPSSLLNVLTTWTVELQSTFGGFVSTTSLTRSVRTTSVIFLGLISSCEPAGTATSAAPRAARLAAPTEEATTAVAPTTSTTSTTSTSLTPSTSSAIPSTTTTSPTSITSAATPTTTTSPTTTTPATTTTTTTPPPPPPTAFIADGGSASSGNFTASIAGNRLSITGTDGATVFEGPVTPSPRYGTGAVWSTDGNLYLLSEGRDPVRVGPSADGPFVSTAVPTSQLPADIAALL